MTPATILQRATEAGLTITRDGENLRVRGPKDARAEITPLLKLHKSAILVALNAPANEAEPSHSRLQSNGQDLGSQQYLSSPSAPSSDLDSLIAAAATFYEYGLVDFELIDEMKRTDPDALRLVFETDPLCPFYLNKDIS